MHRVIRVQGFVAVVLGCYSVVVLGVEGVAEVQGEFLKI
jgi:hypothetical protein